MVGGGSTGSGAASLIPPAGAGCHHLLPGLLTSSAHILLPSSHEVTPLFCYRISHFLLIKPRLSAAWSFKVGSDLLPQAPF